MTSVTEYASNCRYNFNPARRLISKVSQSSAIVQTVALMLEQ